MSGAEAKKTGQLGEDTACLFLDYKGYKIIERNYHKPYGEIDIIAKNDEYIIFVEVKTRRDANFARASEAVSKAKIKKLRMTASMWLSEHGLSEEPVRFDVIEVYTLTQPPKVRHIINAF